MKNLSIILDKRRPLKDGTYPLKLRLLQDGKYEYKSIHGLSIESKHWDKKRKLIKKTHDDYQNLNLLLSKTYSEMHSAFVKHLLTQGGNRKFTLTQNDNDLDFFKYSEKVVSQLEVAKRYGTARAISDGTKKIRKLEIRRFKLSSITPSRLIDWEAKMRSEGLKTNSIACYMRSIRSVYNRAIKEDLFTPNRNAFKVYKIKTEATRNRAISIELLSQIRAFETEENSDLFHAKNLFLLSFYFIGMNFRDVLKITPASFVNGRLNYKRSKTHKQYSIKVLPIAEEILNLYWKRHNTSASMTLFECIAGRNPTSRDLINFTIKLNKLLQKIARECNSKEYICTYSARYTWVRIARDLKVSKDVISEALGHSYGNKVTGVYVDELDHTVVDKMNEVIIDHLLSS